MPPPLPIGWIHPRRLGAIWRLGHRNAPCAYPPRPLCAWRNRFDDPQRQYRTLYGAQKSITCLRELLADLRPNAKALKELDELFGDASTPSLTIAGVVSPQWRRAHVLVQAVIVCPDDHFAKIEDEQTLAFLRREHASLLAGFGMKALRPKDVRTRERIITQQFSRSLYERGHEGIAFISRLDEKPCYVLFEGRASLKPVSAAIPMTRNWPELVEVCGAYSLILRPVKVRIRLRHHD